MQQKTSELSERPAFRLHTPAQRTPSKLHVYFILFTLVFASIVLVGFSRTFFIPVAHGTFSKPLVVHIHAATAVGAAFLLTIGLSEELIGNTKAWLRFAHHMLGV